MLINNNRIISVLFVEWCFQIRNIHGIRSPISPMVCYISKTTKYHFPLFDDDKIHDMFDSPQIYLLVPTYQQNLFVPLLKGIEVVSLIFSLSIGCLVGFFLPTYTFYFNFFLIGGVLAWGEAEAWCCSSLLAGYYWAIFVCIFFDITVTKLLNFFFADEAR